MRQCLGQVLLLGGRYKEADDVYRADLHEYLNNGWSLFGLVEAMKKQPGRYTPAEVSKVQQQLRDTWVRADVTLTSSCLAMVF